jgi:histidinol-phosphate aminotransferase
VALAGAEGDFVKLEGLTKPWIASLQPYPPGKPIEELEREYGVHDSVKLASNENSLGPSPRAVEAMRQALGGVHMYPDAGCFALRRVLAGKLGVAGDALLFGNGSNEIIDLAVRTFVHAGDDAVVADQAFVIYRMAVQAQGGRSVVVPLGEHTHDLEAIAAAVTPRTKMVLLANPNNPTGTFFGRQEWKAFLASLRDDVVVMMDEAYSEYVEDPEYPNALEELAGGHPLIVLRTFSKIYGLAGLRIGYGVADPRLVGLMNRLRAPFNVNSLAQVAAIAALDDPQHLDDTRAMNRAGMGYLEEELRRLGLEFVPSVANFLLVRVGDVADVYEQLLRRGVIVRPVGVYGYPEHVRITIGTRPQNERLVAALRETLEIRREADGVV